MNHRLSMADEENLTNIVESVLNENDVASVLGGWQEMPLNNIDSYAPGDNRIPSLIGKVNRRIPPPKKKKKKSRKIFEKPLDK